jgi:adenosine/AMP kinase
VFGWYRRHELEGGIPGRRAGRIKDVPEGCSVFCATANAVQVVVAQSELGRGVLGAIDGSMPKGVEGAEAAENRRGFLRMIGYKR